MRLGRCCVALTWDCFSEDEFSPRFLHDLGKGGKTRQNVKKNEASMDYFFIANKITIGLIWQPIYSLIPDCFSLIKGFNNSNFLPKHLPRAFYVEVSRGSNRPSLRLRSIGIRIRKLSLVEKSSNFICLLRSKQIL